MVNSTAIVETLMDSFQPNLNKLTITDGDEGVKATAKKRPRQLQDQPADDNGDDKSEATPVKKVKPSDKGTGGKGLKNSEADKGRSSVDQEVTQLSLTAM